jgi:hypothetical protein
MLLITRLYIRFWKRRHRSPGLVESRPGHTLSDGHIPEGLLLGRKAAEEAIDVYRAATKGEKNRTGAVRFVNEKDKDEKELLPPPRRRRTAASAAKKEEKAIA